MPKCQRIQRKKRRVCLGDLNKLITLQNRQITAPLYGSTDFDENFSAIAQVWAAINTVTGKTYFDGVNGDVNITHEIYIRYDASVTSQTWIEYDGRRFDILHPENLDERDEFLYLPCIDRGKTTYEASKA